MPDDTEIRYVSPPEYIKRANARDARARHQVDLRHFMDFYRQRQGEQHVNSRMVDEIIADYLDIVEPAL